MVYWLAELTEPDCPVTLSDEHRDYRWAALADAVQLAGYADLQDVLRETDAFIRNIPRN